MSQHVPFAFQNASANQGHRTGPDSSNAASPEAASAARWQVNGQPQRALRVRPDQNHFESTGNWHFEERRDYSRIHAIDLRHTFSIESSTPRNRKIKIIPI